MFARYLFVACLLRFSSFISELIGEVSRKFAVISKPKNNLSVSRNRAIIIKFVINYHPSAIKLSISSSSKRQSRPVWIET